MSPEISVILSDRWYHLLRCGLRVRSPDVGMTRVELIGTAEQWRVAREAVARSQATSRGAAKSSATVALQRIDVALS